MNDLYPAPLFVDEPPDVRRALRAIPRLAAPYELTRTVRRELIRERRSGGTQAMMQLWPLAAAVQLALLVGLCALYLFATPPTAVVVSDAEPDALKATSSKTTESNKHSHANKGPTTR
jgi:hypothetical protein